MAESFSSSQLYGRSHCPSESLQLFTLIQGSSELIHMAMKCYELNPVILARNRREIFLIDLDQGLLLEPSMNYPNRYCFIMGGSGMYIGETTQCSPKLVRIGVLFKCHFSFPGIFPEDRIDELPFTISGILATIIV